MTKITVEGRIPIKNLRIEKQWSAKQGDTLNMFSDEHSCTW